MGADAAKIEELLKVSASISWLGKDAVLALVKQQQSKAPEPSVAASAIQAAEVAYNKVSKDHKFLERQQSMVTKKVNDLTKELDLEKDKLTRI